MNFYASIPIKRGDSPQTLIIGCEDGATAFDAHAYAQRVLGSEGLLVQQTGEDATPDVCIRWQGSDYSAGGTPKARRLQIRKKVKSGYGPWEDDAP